MKNCKYPKCDNPATKDGLCDTHEIVDYQPFPKEYQMLYDHVDIFHHLSRKAKEVYVKRNPHTVLEFTTGEGIYEMRQASICQYYGFLLTGRHSNRSVKKALVRLFEKLVELKLAYHGMMCSPIRMEVVGISPSGVYVDKAGKGVAFTPFDNNRDKVICKPEEVIQRTMYLIYVFPSTDFPALNPTAINLILKMGLCMREGELPKEITDKRVLKYL